MSLTNDPQVSCLACNAKVETNSTKNIFKTAFAETGEILAPFISSTLSLNAANLRSSHLCLQCLNSFGKLELAQRKVKSIKSDIVKKYLNSCNNNIKTNMTVNNVVQNTPANSEVSFAKRKVVITMQKKIVNISARKPNTTNSVMRNNLDARKTCVMRIKNNYTSVGSTDLKLPEQSSNTTTNTLSPSNVKKTVNLVVDCLPPGLQDHEYTQLFTARSHIDSSQLPRKIVKILKKEPKQEDTQLPKLENPTKPSCGKEVSPQKNLKLNSKTYMCEKCGKVYKSQKSLRLHLVAHDGITPYSCTVCNKHFTQKSTLKKHTLLHAEERNFVCDICSKKFIHRSAFIKHTLSHNQEKIYRCHQCTLTFKRMTHLNRHLRIHAGYKRFCCGICGKRFLERYGVLSHLKVHDPERQRLKEMKMGQKRVIERRCERCNINFTTAREYVVHLHTHTPNNVMVHKENNFTNSV